MGIDFSISILPGRRGCVYREGARVLTLGMTGGSEGVAHRKTIGFVTVLRRLRHEGEGGGSLDLPDARGVFWRDGRNRKE